MIFGKKSLEKLATCHPDLQKIMTRAINTTDVDFGISEGYRPLYRQKQLYEAGLSKIDGIKNKGMHNYEPSFAVDIYAYYDGKAKYNSHHLCYLAGFIMKIASELLEAGEITHGLRWGGNWDGDGKILLDQSFDDMPHFELTGF
jgi:peptidoglycan L-alanyl-D-glutamate endopeptidase CwlK